MPEDGFEKWMGDLRPNPEPDCDDAWHFAPGREQADRYRLDHDAGRTSGSCPTCRWQGSGWLCRDCGREIAAVEIAFRPRCIACHVAKDARNKVQRAQEKIEQDCFDERADQRAALAHHQRILEELDA